MAQSREQMRRPRRVPARVYWIRRVMVLGTAALMVFAIGRLLVGSSDGADSATPNPGAVQAAASITPSVTSSGPKIQLPKGTQKPRKSKPPKPSATPLAQPSGPCASDDVVVAPEARTPVGGGDVVFALSFRTLVSPACTFDVSAKTITMSITSGSDPIWSSVQCPAKIPTTNVVARKDLATYVFVTWNGRRADATCSNRTEWALPGWYHVRVAAFGGEPADEQFELAAPQPATVTTTVIPDPEPTKKPKKPKKPKTG